MTGAESGTSTVTATRGAFRYPRLLCFLFGFALSAAYLFNFPGGLWGLAAVLAVAAVAIAARGPKGGVGTFLLGAVLAPLLMLALLLFPWHIVESWWYSEPFDAAQWRAAHPNPPDPWPTRLRMADDLVATRRLDGFTAVQVEALLGPPDDEPGYRHAFNCDAIWWLGPERGWIRIDSEWLCVNYGADSVVSSYRLARD